MESTVIANLIVNDKKLYATVDGEKLYFVSISLENEEEKSKEAANITAIISEYLLPEKNCKARLGFYIKTEKVDGGSVNYPFINTCEEVAEDAEPLNESIIYGYITNLSALKANARLGENHITMIVKYRSGKKANYVGLRAHGALARRLSKEAKTSDHIHASGIISMTQNRIIIDITEVISLQPSATKKADNDTSLIAK